VELVLEQVVLTFPLQTLRSDMVKFIAATKTLDNKGDPKFQMEKALALAP
jgi:hypothetical protein